MHAKNLLIHFGSAENVFAASKEKIMKIDGVGEKTAEAILNTDALEKAEKHLEFIEKHNVQVLFYADDNYPKRLRNCFDAPLILYFKAVDLLSSMALVKLMMLILLFKSSMD